ncbi:hypothetical protein Hypma_012269 [Hypsizygus marmoreus]|uniref:Uncharacterized protein n=1 Tax=Hypsizygus marmoreus TaxID=39966 RepID=A0A369JFB9_HYPMA|nr:hypothetical protein Hypma_012269 [Hypsizygus marmoreus]
MKYPQALLLVCVGGVALAAAAPVESNDAELVARKFAFRTPRFVPKLNKNRGVGLNSVSRPVDSIPISETPQTASTKAIRELTDDDLLYLRGLEDNTLEARKTIAQLIRELRNKVHRRPTPAPAPALTPAPAQRVQESGGLEDNTLEARMTLAQIILEIKNQLRPKPKPAPVPTLTPEPTSAPAPAQRVQENGGLGDDALEARMTVGQAEVVERDVRRCATKVKPYSTKSDTTASVGKATSAIAGRNLMDDDLLDLRSLEDGFLEERGLAEEFRKHVAAMQTLKWKPKPLVPSAASSPVQRDHDLLVRAVADMFEVNDLD